VTNPIAVLRGVATFLGGVSAALLASYPIPSNSMYICFIALFVALAACIIGAGAIALYATKQHAAHVVENQVEVQQLVNLTVDQLLQRRGLELVERE
jgi:hypothetical protein